MKLIFSVFLLISASIFLRSHSGQEEKINLEQLIQRHLDSIGPKEARSAVTSRAASGRASLLIRLGGAANLEGTGMMASVQEKLRFGMRFSANDYVGEDMAFDGNQASTGFQPHGKRSLLSQFLDAQPVILKEGLIGGVLSTAWPLGRIEKSQPKLEYRGLKKLEDLELHEVAYRPKKGGGDLKITALLRASAHAPRPQQIQLSGGSGHCHTRSAKRESGDLLFSDRRFRKLSNC